MIPSTLSLPLVSLAMDVILYSKSNHLTPSSALFHGLGKLRGLLFGCMSLNCLTNNCKNCRSQADLQIGMLDFMARHLLLLIVAYDKILTPTYRRLMSWQQTNSLMECLTSSCSITYSFLLEKQWAA